MPDTSSGASGVEIARLIFAADDTQLLEAEAALNKLGLTAEETSRHLKTQAEIFKRLEEEGNRTVQVFNQISGRFDGVSKEVARFGSNLHDLLLNFNLTRAEGLRLQATMLGVEDVFKEQINTIEVLDAATKKYGTSIHTLGDIEKAEAAEKIQLAEKAAIEQIKWNELSVKTRIAQLELLKKYQADSAIGEDVILKTFGAAAIKDLPNLSLYIAALDGVSGAQKKVANASGIAAGEINKTSHATARATSELVVMTRELSQGNFTRLVGSFSIFSQALGFTLNPLTLLAAGLLGVGYEAAKGNIEFDKFNAALISTNNFAGTTAGGLEALAKQAASTGGSILVAKEAVVQLAASGQFTSDQIATISAAAVQLEHATGQSIDKTIKQFESLASHMKGTTVDGTLQVARAALKLDEQYHFLTASVIEHIIELERQGRAQEASRVATEALAEATRQGATEMIDNLGSVATAWNTIKDRIIDVINRLNELGQKESAARKVAEAKTEIALLEGGGGTVPGVFNETSRLEKLAEAREKLRKATEELNKEEEKSRAQGERNLKTTESNRAITELSEQRARLQKQSFPRVEQELKSQEERLKKIREANTEEFPSPDLLESNIKRDQDAIIKYFSDKTKTTTHDDGRATELTTDINGSQSKFARVKQEVDAQRKILAEQRRGELISNQTYIAKLQEGYDKEFEALKKTYKEKTDLLDNFQKDGKVRDKAELERIQKRKQEVDDDFLKQKARINNEEDIEIARVQADEAKARKRAGNKSDADARRAEDIRLKAQLDAIKGQEDTEKQIYENALKDLADIHKAGKISDETYYDDRKQIREAYLSNLAIEFKKENDILNSRKTYDKATAADKDRDIQQAAIRQKKIIDAVKAVDNNDQIDAQNAFDKTIKDSNTELNKYISTLDAQSQKLEESTRVSGFAKSEIELLSLSRIDDAIATTRQTLALAEFNGESEKTIAAYKDQLKFLEELRRATDRNAKARSSEDQAKAAEKLAAEYEKVTQKIEGLLTDALVNGGKSAIRQLKTMFANLVLEPIIKPIAQDLASFFVPGGADAASARRTSNTASGTVGGAGAYAGQGYISTAFSKFMNTGAFGGMIGTGVQKAGILTGSQTVNDFGYGMQMSNNGAIYTEGNAAAGYGQIAGTAANIIAGALIGHYGGNLISDGYAVGGSPNAASNTGTAIGAAIGTVISPGIGTAVGAAIGGLIGGVVNRLFGMKDKEITGQGLIGDLSGGKFNGQNYFDWKQEGGFFRSDRKGRDFAAMDQGVASAVGLGLNSLLDKTNEFARILGVAERTDFSVSNFKVPLQHTKETGDQVKDAQAKEEDARVNLENFNKALANIANQLADQTIPNLKDFAQIGETSAQTYERLAGLIAATDNVAKLLGKDTKTSFGQVGIASYKARQYLIDLAGGIDNLTSGAQFFAENFLSEDERITIAMKQVNEEMTKFGYRSVVTRKEFRDIVQGLDLSTESGAQMYTELIKLAPAFDQVADYMEKVSDKVASIDEAKSQLEEAYNKESDALKELVDAYKDSAKTIRETIAELRKGDLSPLTPIQKYQAARDAMLATEQKASTGDKDALNDLGDKVKDFLDASRVVNASGLQYQADFENAMTDLQRFAGYADQFSSDKQSELDKMTDQVSALIEINKSVISVKDAIDQLKELTGTPLPRNVWLQTKMSTTGTILVDGSHAGGLDSVPFDGYVAQLHRGERVLTSAESMDYNRYSKNAGNEALVEEIKALREEVSQLRSEQKEQTISVVKAQYDSTDRAADKVADGVKDTTVTSNWRNRIQANVK